jgi:hypothetical protein
MAQQLSRTARAAIPVFLVAALFAGAVEAKGGRRSSSSSSSSFSKSHSNESGTDSGGFHPSITVRTSSSSSSESGSEPHPVPPPAAQRAGGSQAPAGEPAADAEEEARRAANLAIYHRLQSEKAAAAKAAAEKAEADRLALEKILAARNAQFAAEQRAAAAKVAAAQEQKRREQAVVAADVDRVLQRAKADYPMLSTPEGEPVMRKIIDRQQALAARGIYPSIAMVEAISDHAHDLVARRKPELRMVSTDSAQAAQPRSFDGCRWVTSIKWSCD